MKNTLSATGDAGNVDNRYNMLMGGKKNLDKETGDNVRVRRAGPGLAKMRKAHKTLRSIILQRCARTPSKAALLAPYMPPACV